jgi:hypothetical protein
MKEDAWQLACIKLLGKEKTKEIFHLAYEYQFIVDNKYSKKLLQSILNKPNDNGLLHGRYALIGLNPNKPKDTYESLYNAVNNIRIRLCEKLKIKKTSTFDDIINYL